MPRERLPMRKIEEVLRLRAAGMSPRLIAESTGAGKSTVYEYLARADASGICWPLPEGLDEAAVEAKLFPPPSAELANRRPVPNWREIHRELKAGRHVTMRLLWLEWRGANPEAWGYSQFCAHYQAWLGGQDVVMRLSYRAGERMFVDFSGDTASYVSSPARRASSATQGTPPITCGAPSLISRRRWRRSRGPDCRRTIQGPDSCLLHLRKDMR
jgi:hypothetical protein